MKQTIKTRLLAVLAFSSVTVGGSLGLHAQDGFGIVRPVKPARQASARDQVSPMPPIVSSEQSNANQPREFELPPIVSGRTPEPMLTPQVSAGTDSLKPQTPPKNNTPLAFAPSKIRHADFDPSADPTSNQQVGFSKGGQTLSPPLEMGRMTVRDSLPPIVSSTTESTPPPIVGPNDPAGLPPILSGSNEFSASAVQPSAIPIVSQPPTAMDQNERLSRLQPFAEETSALGRLPMVDDATLVSDGPDEGKTVRTGYSSAGVPIYAGSPPPMSVMQAPPMDSSSDQQPAMNVPPIVADVTQEPGSIDVAAGLPRGSVVPPQPIPLLSAPPASGAIDPTYNPGMLNDSSLPMQGMTRTPAGESYFMSPMNEAPVISNGQLGCTSCGNATGGCSSCSNGVVSGCQSCGPNGCYDTNSVTGQFNACGSCANARRYLIAEALYFDRDDGFISNSNFGSLGNFDFNAGWRFTLGRRSDSTRGREISYMGTLPMDQNRQSFSPAGNITSRFIAADGFGAAQTAGFFNATQQSEAKQTSFHSLELNRVKWGWDVMKTYVGVRYLLVDDSYTMFSQSIGGDQGFFQMETMNHLFGPHVGAELFYDVGYRLSFSAFSKAGVYANFNETDTVMVHNGTRFIDRENTGGTISTSYEAGLTAHYRLNRQARFRFGYNILYLGDVASVSDNFPRLLTPSTGSNVDDSDDMFFHGLSVGFEIYR